MAIPEQPSQSVSLEDRLEIIKQRVKAVATFLSSEEAKKEREAAEREKVENEKLLAQIESDFIDNYGFNHIKVRSFLVKHINQLDSAQITNPVYLGKFVFGNMEESHIKEVVDHVCCNRYSRGLAFISKFVLPDYPFVGGFLDAHKNVIIELSGDIQKVQTEMDVESKSVEPAKAEAPKARPKLRSRDIDHYVTQKNWFLLVSHLLESNDENLLTEKTITNINQHREEIRREVINQLNSMSDVSKRNKLREKIFKKENLIGKVLSDPRNACGYFFSLRRYQGQKVNKSIKKIMENTETVAPKKPKK